MSLLSSLPVCVPAWCSRLPVPGRAGRLRALLLFSIRVGLAWCCLAAGVVHASGYRDLIIASGGKTTASVWVYADGGPWEIRAAEDLTRCIRLMTGATPKLIRVGTKSVVPIRADGRPRLIVGRLALEVRPELRKRLAGAAKKNPILRADAVVLERRGNTVFLAGNNDDSHYYAVSTLLHRWGCRWYLPTDFGECIPVVAELKVASLNMAYGSPFEVRRYWISWNGSTEGKDVFMRRNFFNEVMVPSGHNLGEFTRELVPPGKTMFQVPIAEDRTADHVASKVTPLFAAGKDVQLGMEDGVYESDSPLDRELLDLRFDKYFLKPSATDAFLTFYNKVAKRLLDAYPVSPSKIGFLAYANITLPPVRIRDAAKPLIAYLAPIDIDPIHPMDSPLSAPRREYRDMVFDWAKVMQGRVVIYDYDQSMMVWRDIPAPSLQLFQHDVRQYESAGILGVDTESRGAFATIFTNLFYRGQLLWNPRADITALENRFYKDFFGPAAAPMQRYWSAIYEAWAETVATEHEIHIFPAVYTPELLQTLRRELKIAESIVGKLSKRPNRGIRELRWQDRMRFLRRSFDILDAYAKMSQSATVDCDYPAAVKHGERGLAVREELTAQSDIFTTYKRIGESGAAWWPGEVEQFRRLASLTGGERGVMVQPMPLAWLFRTDPENIGARERWQETPIEMAPWDGWALDWREVRQEQRDWQWLLTSVYAQAQGIFDSSHQPYTGVAWYRVDVDLPPGIVGKRTHLMFPGLFNEATLYINGKEIARRSGYNPVWWMNSYEFEWDVALADVLRPGRNTFALRIDNPHHMGGMFRRPFLYEVR